MRTFYRSLDGKIHRKDGVLGCCDVCAPVCCDGDDSFVTVVIEDTVPCGGSTLTELNIDGTFVCAFVSSGVWQYRNDDIGITVDVTCVDNVFYIEAWRDGQELGFRADGVLDTELPNDFTVADCDVSGDYNGTAIVSCGGTPTPCCPDESDLVLDLGIGGEECHCWSDGTYYYKFIGGPSGVGSGPFLPNGSYTLVNTASGVWEYTGQLYSFSKYTSAEDCADDVDGVLYETSLYITVTCTDSLYTITVEYYGGVRVFEGTAILGVEFYNEVLVTDCGTANVAVTSGIGKLTCVTP